MKQYLSVLPHRTFNVLSKTVRMSQSKPRSFSGIQWAFVDLE